MKNRPGSKLSRCLDEWRADPAVRRWCQGPRQVTGLTATETAARLDLLLEFCVRHAVAPQTLVDACRSGPDKMARRALYLKTAQADRRANRVVQSFLVHNGINIFGELVCLPRGSQQVAAEQGGQWASGGKRLKKTSPDSCRSGWTGMITFAAETVAMPKYIHEIRDPIHVFIHLDSDEREVVNSRPFQRLRHVHQLALTYLVYPGATHKRFEHSLGVMELAGRVFDVVTNLHNVTDSIKNLLDPLSSPDHLMYWRRVLRMAALCHDIGHLPFSHAAEKELLPDGWDHERLTRDIVSGDEMKAIWNSMTPPLRPGDIEKLAVGPKKAKNETFTDWEAILSEIVVGDAFGVDRMDYLLRDSHHIGVAYGKFDHHRLIDTLRILPPSNESGGSQEPALGVEEGGIQSAEALILARYFMYSQVYFHPVRRVYDIYLRDFLKEWLDDGFLPTDLESHLNMTDNEITAALRDAVSKKDQAGYLHARRIIQREHFKRIYERNPKDAQINPESGEAIFAALCSEYGEEHFRHDRYSQRSGGPDFPVRMRDGRIVSSLAVSDALKSIPVVSVDYVFADRSISDEACGYVDAKREDIIELKEEDNA